MFKKLNQSLLKAKQKILDKLIKASWLFSKVVIKR